MKQFPAKDLTRNTADLWTAATIAPVTITKHRKACFVVMSVERYEELVGEQATQVSLDVANMPDELGELFDKGVEDRFRDR
ncbi:type II toxin-antitoxin system Phd/YefM family antitoxin [Phaeobacter inhibens]|uniref:type II toxin-antitoxin system Phd/YefM family antitoxin n=1 Tax=Phaeobacter inhibens TaxID=221822 RepID=UPI00097182D2|nr:type II toxin-antitoxin system Phd/YefM family antitoxin [Phaeobacter inhibens]APX18106.1 prevent-host-death protein [Phaeobacter inhibens]UWR62784.1 type II toxin-antitoxin system Phd/YefM family antitoxin [Phaeobacter inhibens]